MDLVISAITYAAAHTTEFALALRQHVALVGVALAVAVALCVPLGVWTSRSDAAAVLFINTSNALRVVPSLAVLFLAIPYFGLSFTSASLALTLLALPPVLINTDAAYRTISPAIKEAALGMGMTPWQVLRHIETPLALPVIISGIRTATTYRQCHLGRLHRHWWPGPFCRARLCPVRHRHSAGRGRSRCPAHPAGRYEPGPGAKVAPASSLKG